MNDVLALGELVIDFTPEGVDPHGYPQYTANPGGAPANVLVSLAQLGRRTEMIAAVGEDSFGEQIKESLREKNVGISRIITSDIHTTLAFVHLDELGERSFSFCRNPGADIMLQKEDLPLGVFTETKIFHVGSVTMTDDPARSTMMVALEAARKNEVTISFDPNLRPPLWDRLAEAKKQIEVVLHYANVVKVSEEELEFLVGIKDIEAAAKQLYETFALDVLFVTLGAEGSYVITDDHFLFAPGFPVQTIDTTGCGDAFFGGALHKFLEKDFLETKRSEAEWFEVLSFGNAMGAYVAQFKGGIPSMPTGEEIEQFMSNHE